MLPIYITGNHVLDVSLLCWLVAQSLKVIFVLIQQKKLDLRRMVGSGGMPSSHTAFVTGLTTAVAYEAGYQSPLFAACVVLSLVVMYDATNVRKAAGDQATILNYMMEHWNDQTPELFQRNLKELLGHTPFQVVVGAVIGIGLGILCAV